MKTQAPRHQQKPTPHRLRLVRDLPAVDARRIAGGATPKLLEAACKGTHFKEVVITN